VSFFHFQLTAVAPGIAHISFLDASGSDVDGNPISPTLANALQVEVLGTAARFLLQPGAALHCWPYWA